MSVATPLRAIGATQSCTFPVLERSADKKQRDPRSDNSATPPVGLVAVG